MPNFVTLTINTDIGEIKIDDGKFRNQIPNRGWTEKDIVDTINNPIATSPATNKATGNPATAYFSPDGSYLTVDSITNELVQVSNNNDKGWIPDSSITNPWRKQ